VAGVILGERRPWLTRDWGAYAAGHAPDLVCHDHRLLGWGTLHGVAAWMQRQQVLVELAPDAGARMDHVTIAEHGALRSIVISGTRDGGTFEIAFLRVDEVDASGRICRIDLYDFDKVDDALARFAEIAAAGAIPLPPLAKPTAGTRAVERLYQHIDTQNWDAARRACAPHFTFEDRRAIVGVSGDVELMIASCIEVQALGLRSARREVLATAGDRVTVIKHLWAAGPSDGRVEVEYLTVHEIDADGLYTTIRLFDAADPLVAQREAWARWAAIDPTMAEMTTNLGAVGDAWNAKDLDRLRALLAEDLAAEDHRRTGIGRSEGREAYLQSVAVLWELAPDSRLDVGLVWLVHAPHGGVHLCRRSGRLPDGGEFVAEFLVLIVLERELAVRLEVFEVDAADAALARFAALRPDPLRIPPNAVARTLDRVQAAVRAGDDGAVMALFAPSCVVEDRRALFRTSSTVGEGRGNVRWAMDGGWTGTSTLIATAGDRLALHRIVWSTGDAGARAEIETFNVDEVDADARLVRSLIFDPDDRAAAFRALGYRHLQITRPSAMARVEALRAADGDLTRLRAAFPDDFFFHDRRRTGLGKIDGADAYVRSVVALRELAPDATVGMPLYHLADDPHGTLSIAHSFGTLANGGAFESVYVMITLYGSNGITGVELFELEDLEAAKARFAELGVARTT
jgi:hypothetical protein